MLAHAKSVTRTRFKRPRWKGPKLSWAQLCACFLSLIPLLFYNGSLMPIHGWVISLIISVLLTWYGVIGVKCLMHFMNTWNLIRNENDKVTMRVATIVLFLLWWLMGVLLSVEIIVKSFANAKEVSTLSLLCLIFSACIAACIMPALWLYDDKPAGTA